VRKRRGRMVDLLRNRSLTMASGKLCLGVTVIGAMPSKTKVSVAVRRD